MREGQEDGNSHPVVRNIRSLLERTVQTVLRPVVSYHLARLSVVGSREKWMMLLARASGRCPVGRSDQLAL